MERLEVSQLKEGYITAKNVVGSDHGIIIAANNTLTGEVIELLAKKQVEAVYVHGSGSKSEDGTASCAFYSVQAELAKLQERFELVHGNELMDYVRNVIRDAIMHYENF